MQEDNFFRKQPPPPNLPSDDNAASPERSSSPAPAPAPAPGPERKEPQEPARPEHVPPKRQPPMRPKEPSKTPEQPQPSPKPPAPPETSRPSEKPSSTPSSPPPAAPQAPAEKPEQDKTSSRQPQQPSPPPRQQPSQQSPQRTERSYSPEQKQAYLDRGEVRTMEKDMARMREEEAKEEQRRIAELKTQENREKEKKAVQRIRASAQEVKKQEEAQRAQERKRIQDSILPPGEERRVRDLPSPPSHKKRVFVRVLIVVVFAFIALNVALFGYWYFFQNNSVSLPQISLPFFSQSESPAPSPQPQPSPQPSPQPAPQPSPEPSPQPSAPPPTSSISSLVDPSHTSTLQFSGSGALADVLEQAKNEQQRSGFTELLFRRMPENTFVETGTAFLNVFGVQPPSSVATQFEGDMMFFLYPSENGNRFGMVVETQSAEQARQAMSQWEENMEEQLTGLFSFWGAPGAGYSSSFRSATHAGVEFRFQTFSRQDIGLVYAVFDNYIVFTSSYEAATATIDQLQSSMGLLPPRTFASSGPVHELSQEQALGQMLMIGFEGSTVTPEVERLLKRLQPGGVLLLSKNIKSADQLKQLTRDLQRVSLEYSSLPLFIAVDQEGGLISRVDFGKEKTAQSAIQNAAHAYAVGRERGEELESLGVNLNLSPVLDHTDPDDFLFGRTFQAESKKSGELAQSLVRGQKEAGILSTLKHFPGYASIPFNPEHKLATVPSLPDISSFVPAFAEEPEFLLTSNVIYSELDPTQPFTFSAEGISWLRSRFAFPGIIVSDDLSQPSLMDNYPLETIATAPLQAGVTMLMFSKEDYAQEAYALLGNAVESDPSLRANMQQAADRIVQVKKGFFDVSDSSAHLSQK